MRKLLIPLLLAGAVAAPALADPSTPDQVRERHQARADREQRQQSADSNRRKGEAAPAHVQRVEVQPAKVQQVDVQRVVQADARVRSSNQGDRPQRVQFRQQRVDFNQQRDMRERRAGFGQDRVDPRAADLRETNRPMPPELRNRVVTGTPRQGTQPPPPDRVRTSRAPQWSGNWRNDRRYDWHDYRNRNRARFHIGYYYDPFGWGYSPFSIGYRLWPSYYSSRYWIADPWQYRLPYAPPGTRWVRYWDDAILVDTWNGQVVDVIHNFFW